MNLNDCLSQGLLREYHFPQNTAKKELSNAKKHLKNARICIRDKMYDLAIVSIYTAMFHTARAVLFRDNLKERSHICVILYLKEKYPELKEFAEILDVFREQRHNMLYGLDSEGTKEDAFNGIEEAEKFIQKVKEIIEVSNGNGI